MYCGANRANSWFRHSTSSSIGALISDSYFSLRGWNHSRRLLRLSARRKERASGEKPENCDFVILGTRDTWAMEYYLCRRESSKKYLNTAESLRRTTLKHHCHTF